MWIYSHFVADDLHQATRARLPSRTLRNHGRFAPDAYEQREASLRSAPPSLPDRSAGRRPPRAHLVALATLAVFAAAAAATFMPAGAAGESSGSNYRAAA